MDATTRLLSDLVAIPSVNPMGRALTGPHYLEGRVTDYLESFFRSIGVASQRREISPGRDNLLARFDPPGPTGKVILFDVHQDTVPVDGMTIPPFSPEQSGGRLYGRGACDIKGGMAAMLAAFARLVRERPRSASVVLACTVDEEFTHTGSSRLALDHPPVDLAVVAEPTMLNLVDRHKGAVRWKVRTRGVACHSSTPQLGENAIYKMARVVSALAAHAEELARSSPDPVLGPPSLSVGRIEGGLSVNVVPDWCEVDIDRRIIPGEAAGDCPGRVKRALIEQLGDLPGVEFLPPWVNMPALVPGRAEPFLPALKAAIARVGGRVPEVMGVPYGTDAGPLGDAGLPCVVFGPGDIAQAHTRDEWIELDQVRQAAEMYFEIARELA